jgi:hypothetical protein
MSSSQAVRPLGRSGIIASGVRYRRLEAPGVEELVGSGVYYGAAPGEADEYRDVWRSRAAPTPPARRPSTSPARQPG